MERYKTTHDPTGRVWQIEDTLVSGGRQRNNRIVAQNLNYTDAHCIVDLLNLGDNTELKRDVEVYSNALAAIVATGGKAPEWYRQTAADAFSQRNNERNAAADTSTRDECCRK
jgi:hypothetical protein